MLQTATGFAQALAPCAIRTAAELHYRRRAAVDAHLLLDRDAPHIVAIGQGAVVPHPVLGHDVERKALDAGDARRVPRQHEVQDVGVHAVVAVADEAFLAPDAAAAGPVDRARAYHPDVGSRVGLRHRERRRPATAHEGFQVAALLILGSEPVQQRHDACERHQRQAEGDVGRLEELRHGDRHRCGQALAADVVREMHRVPARLDELSVGRLPASGRADCAVWQQGAAFPVSDGVERREHLLREAARLAYHFVDGVLLDARVGPGEQFAQPGPRAQREEDLLHLGREHAHAPSPRTCAARAASAARSSLPTVVRGTASTKSTRAGTL